MTQNVGKSKSPTSLPQSHTSKPQTSPAQENLSSSFISNKTLDDERTDLEIELPSQPQAPQPQSATQPTLNPQRGSSRMPDLGLLEPFMKDPLVSEIMVNDLRNIMIEKNGTLYFSGFAFQTLEDLNRITRNILDVTGKILTPELPYVDVMLPDGSRINIVAPPITLVGPCITIRKFPNQRPSIQDLIKNETLNQRIAYFLNACVLGQLNILISGGTSSGKTTLLNVLTSFIPKDERIITIEDTPELYIQHMNSVRLQIKPQTPSSAAVTSHDLLVNALRMRPDRIIVGESRRTEAFDMLQAMNTGHSGSMTTLHANSPRDALSRLETLCMLNKFEISQQALRKQISNALDLIIQIQRMKNGKRKITAVTEVTGMEGETITLQDIFVYENPPHSSESHQESGTFKTLGLVPTFMDRLAEKGIQLPKNYFG